MYGEYMIMLEYRKCFGDHVTSGVAIRGWHRRYLNVYGVYPRASGEIGDDRKCVNTSPILI